MNNTIDGVTIEVMRNALQSIAEEMGVTLIKTSMSPNIKDRMDCSSAIYTKKGELIAQAEHIPLHLGLMPSVVKEVLKIHPAESLREGDAILINDPYISGSHLPDIFLITPVFDCGELIAIAGCIAHHVDVGGITPGSASTYATEIFQEGLRIPAIKIVNKGKINNDFLRLFQSNVRSKESKGDLYAQISANNVAEKRIKELFQKYGAHYMDKCMEEIIKYSEKRMRNAISKVKNGSFYFEDYLEGDGLDCPDLKIATNVHIYDESITIDFEGTDSQVKASLNSTIGVTQACGYYAIKALFDKNIPTNVGTFKPINIKAPLGSLVNPKFPAAVSNGNAITSQRIVDTIFGALAKVLPDKSMAACTGTMNGLTIAGFDDEKNEYFSYIETYGGGQGAMLGQDGMDGVHTNMTNTKNTPIEVIEQTYPISILQYSLADNSCGSGKYRGGMGLIREIQIDCEEATVSLRMERSRIKPWGLFGGNDGENSSCYFTEAKTGKIKKLPPKFTITAKKGDIIRIQSAGGGGYQSAQERDREKINSDILNGNIDYQSAEENYSFMTLSLN